MEAADTVLEDFVPAREADVDNLYRVAFYFRQLQEDQSRQIQQVVPLSRRWEVERRWRLRCGRSALIRGSWSGWRRHGSGSPRPWPGPRAMACGHSPESWSGGGRVTSPRRAAPNLKSLTGRVERAGELAGQAGRTVEAIRYTVTAAQNQLDASFARARRRGTVHSGQRCAGVPAGDAEVRRGSRRRAAHGGRNPGRYADLLHQLTVELEAAGPVRGAGSRR